MKKLLAAAVIAALPLAFVPVAANAAPVGTPSQISNFANPQDFDNCFGPAVAYNPDSGKTLAGWTTYSPGLNIDESVEVTLLGSDGTGGSIDAYADETVPGSNDCNVISIAAGPDGGFIVIWTDDEKILGIKVNSSGAFVGSHFVVSSEVSYLDVETQDVEWSSEHNKFLVAWSGVFSGSLFPSATGGQQLVGRFIDATGAGLGSDFLITNDPNTYDNSMDIAYGDGVWAVVGNADNGDYPMVTFVSDDGGLSTEASCQATPATMGGASIAYNASTDSFLCAWKGSGSDVYYNVMDSTGALSEIADVQLDSDGSVSGKPRVESLGENGWLFTWHGAGSRDVFGASIDVTGALVGELEYVSAGLDDSSLESNFRPSVAFSPSTGHAYIAWARNDTVAAETEVYARAWYVTEPELADTGFDALIPAVAGFALAALGVAALRRRSVA